MKCFSKKPDNPKSKIRWIEKVTQQDIDTLPLILIGLNYQNYFPKSLHVVPSELRRENPGMAFFKSLFSKRWLGSGVKEVRTQSELVNVVQYKYDEIYNDCRDFSYSPISSNLDEIEHMGFQYDEVF